MFGIISNKIYFVIQRMKKQKDLEKEQYSYQLVMELRKKSNDIFCLREGTLYPTLYCLEKKRLVVGVDGVEWLMK